MTWTTCGFPIDRSGQDGEDRHMKNKWRLISQVATMTRWQDWGPGKITIFCSLSFYIAVAYRLPFYDFLLAFALFMLFASAQAAFGFIVNNWGDRDLDRSEGKYNPFNETSYLKGLSWLLSICAIAFLTALPLLRSRLFLALWALWLCTMTAYSLPPLRLKTRGFWGLLVSFLSQWSLPVLLAFCTFDRYGGWDMWLWAAALTVSGATLEVAHQRYDRERDLEADAITFGAGLSPERLNRIYSVFYLSRYDSCTFRSPIVRPCDYFIWNSMGGASFDLNFRLCLTSFLDLFTQIAQCMLRQRHT